MSIKIDYTRMTRELGIRVRGEQESVGGHLSAAEVAYVDAAARRESARLGRAVSRANFIESWVLFGASQVLGAPVPGSELVAAQEAAKAAMLSPTMRRLKAPPRRPSSGTFESDGAIRAVAPRRDTERPAAPGKRRGGGDGSGRR